MVFNKWVQSLRRISFFHRWLLALHPFSVVEKNTLILDDEQSSSSSSYKKSIAKNSSTRERRRDKEREREREGIMKWPVEY